MRRGGAGRGLAASLVGTWLVMAALLPSRLQAAPEQFDCRTLADQGTPSSADEWFQRSLWASHCYIYQARAVRIGADGVRSLALSHDIHQGVEREVARFLDGPAVVFERRGRVGRMGWSPSGQAMPASPEGIVDHLEGLYRLQRVGEERIANRHALRLDIEPLDGLRYGHRFWLDTATALPLKQMLIDEQGRVVETFQITELGTPRLHDGEVNLDRGRPPPDGPWSPGWLPEGFIGQPVETRSARHRNVGHRVYSDGLSTLSLFIEPLEDQDLLIPGMHRLGVSHAAVRHRELGGQPMQVVVMGELPPRVLLRVADSVVWQGQASSSANAPPASASQGDDF
ncbi:MucB/RseB C-terminal domain-containing protein [Halomonas cerina]|uniref:Sigma-E factor negative regulatory protein RseB n=1 Tax=Halomonas cerina TaxID=447424 RepID=A0A839VF30_9GAMM|nr:MucB/RseB C-terminal domain-containing protein [Halomonas cerina]MBB3191076.1 sigma-E factor negative regulatory protein RseB [Halomonas cerina]